MRLGNTKTFRNKNGFKNAQRLLLKMEARKVDLFGLDITSLNEITIESRALR